MANKKQKVVIVGAGGLGRELFAYLSAEPDRFEVLGFIDDSPEDPLEGYDYPVGVLSSISAYQPREDEQLLLAIMSPKAKARVTGQLKEKGGRFLTYIHPSAFIGHNVCLGEGVVIAPHCILTADIAVGDFFFLNTSSTLGHDVRVGDWVSINGKCEMCGSVALGDRVLVGACATIIPEKKVASDAFVGAGSVVVSDVVQTVTVFGNPAKKIT